MRSRVLLGVAVLAAAAVVAGCSEIPTSGPVNDAGAVGPQPGDLPDYVEVREAPPRQGMTPTQIVDGFVDAMSSYQPGYEIAKQYLTEEAAAEWDPSAGVTVYYEARPRTEVRDQSTVHVRMTVHGQVGRDGAFTENAEPTPQEFDLQLEQVDGEWRIANPVPGILIADFSFDREYQPRDVYFFSPSLDVLVPDVVYLPRTANDATATLLARAVLAGPTDWLAPAVVTAFPEGAELDIDSVPVRNGVAIVDLGPDVALADADARLRMAAQLTWTLGVLPEVDEVQVLSGTAPLIRNEPMAPDHPELRGFDPAVLSPESPLYAIGEAGVVAVIDGEIKPVAGPLAELAEARELAVNLGGNRGAVVTPTPDGGTQVQIASFGEDEPLETLIQGGDLTSLAWDRSGLVWAVDHSADGHGIVVSRPDGRLVEVVAPELDTTDVRRLAVSPDGARVALVIGEGQAMVGNVIRDAESNETLRIEQLRPVGPGEGIARDVAWTSSSPSWSAADTVVVLLENDQQVQPVYVGLSGQEVVPRGLQVDDGERVAGSPGLPVVLQSADGVLFMQRSSNTWTEIGPAHSPAYPG